MIISSEQAITISKALRQGGNSLVLAGGCFDIIHLGHISFLKKAKEQGDVLFIMLESDEKITKTKGNDRPYNTQKERAEVLQELRSVDYVITLPYFSDHEQYNTLVKAIKPAIIATTKNDPNISHKKRQGEEIGAKVKEVIETITGHSTSLKVQKLYKNDEL